MNQLLGRYILASEIVVPTGMNFELAMAVATADLARFEQYDSSDDRESYTVARADFLTVGDIQGKIHEILDVLLCSLLAKVPQSLKPLPLQLCVPESVCEKEVHLWLEESDHTNWISRLTINKCSGNRFISECLDEVNECDALMCIAIDSLVNNIDNLIQQSNVISKSAPWGIIPSEGGAGFILTKKNIIETLKLKPLARIDYADFDWDSTDRRGCTRLVRRASKYAEQFGRVYSDMANMRSHTEDYGFAIGAASERFYLPQNVVMTNDLWGTIGGCSGIAVLTTFSRITDKDESGCMLLFGLDNSRALLLLSAC